MPNIVITTTTGLIKVVFNDESSKVSMDKGTWRKDKVQRVILVSDHVEVQTQDDHRWLCVDSATDNFLIIDTIDGASPSSLLDLYDKLVAIAE